MRAAVLAWALVLALYLIRALASWVEAQQRIRLAFLPPRRRKAETRAALVEAIAWPFFEAVGLTLLVRGDE